jgi:hypothetical protein
MRPNDIDCVKRRRISTHGWDREERSKRDRESNVNKWLTKTGSHPPCRQGQGGVIAIKVSLGNTFLFSFLKFKNGSYLISFTYDILIYTTCSQIDHALKLTMLTQIDHANQIDHPATLVSCYVG